MNGKSNKAVSLSRDAYIKEHCVSVGISVMPINTIESLWELDIAHSLS